MRKSRAPTMADVARIAGVSPMTVSRALREGTLISEATRKKIIAAAEEVGYVLDANASAFATGRTGFVAMTIPSINNGNFADTVRGVSDTLRGSGLELLLGYTNYDVEEEERLVRALLGRRPEAMIVTGGAHTEACRRYLESCAGAVIECWDTPKDPIRHVVGFSNAEAGRLVAEHLIARGYRRIGFVGGDSERDTRGADRRRGFLTALETHGLDADRLTAQERAPTMMKEGAAAMAALLDRWPDTDAVMCVSDIAAFGALSEARSRGLRVPEDLGLAGFGAYEISEFAHPQLTTIDVKAYEIGVEAARIVLETSEASDIIRESIDRRVAIDVTPRASTARGGGGAVS